MFDILIDEIDKKELFDGFKRLGLECSRQQIQDIMKEMNQDENTETLTFEEFKHCIQKWGGAILVCFILFCLLFVLLHTKTYVMKTQPIK